MNSFSFIFADTKINKLLLIFTNCQSEPNKKSDEFLTKLSTCTKSFFDEYAVVSPAGAQRFSSLAAGGGIGKAWTGNELPKSCKVSHEASPPLAPNCLLGVRQFYLCLNSLFFVCRHA